MKGILSLDELSEIKARHDDFMYPSPNEFGIKEEDVERLIYSVRQQDKQIRCLEQLCEQKDNDIQLMDRNRRKWTGSSDYGSK